MSKRTKSPSPKSESKIESSLRESKSPSPKSESNSPSPPTPEGAAGGDPPYLPTRAAQREYQRRMAADPFGDTSPPTQSQRGDYSPPTPPTPPPPPRAPWPPPALYRQVARAPEFLDPRFHQRTKALVGDDPEPTEILQETGTDRAYRQSEGGPRAHQGQNLYDILELNRNTGRYEILRRERIGDGMIIPARIDLEGEDAVMAQKLPKPANRGSGRRKSKRARKSRKSRKSKKSKKSKKARKLRKSKSFRKRR